MRKAPDIVGKIRAVANPFEHGDIRQIDQILRGFEGGKKICQLFTIAMQVAAVRGTLFDELACQMLKEFLADELLDDRISARQCIVQITAIIVAVDLDGG